MGTAFGAATRDRRRAAADVDDGLVADVAARLSDMLTWQPREIAGVTLVAEQRKAWVLNPPTE
jgi:hypothetical protein